MPPLQALAMPENLELFPLKGDFRLASLQTHDVRSATDDLKHFERLVLESEPMYPGIRRWLHNRVLGQLNTGRRVALLAYESNRPVASAVLKMGHFGKFCHLRVTRMYQDVRLGELFFALMALGCRKAQEIHFTLPESLWEEKRHFFTTFGFEKVELSLRQYRPNERELLCSAAAATVIARALKKAPQLTASFTMLGRGIHPALLMSVAPRHAHAIMRGEKRVEVRRRFADKWEGARVVLYATRPEATLVGQVTVSRIVRDSPTNIWTAFGRWLGCERTEFFQYAGQQDEVAALVLEDPDPYVSPIPLTQLSHWSAQDLAPPQSYQAVEPEDAWGHALVLASFLNGRFTSRPRPRRQPNV
jgi:predicted transcriptional regulator